MTAILSYLLKQPLQTVVIPPASYAATYEARGLTPEGARLMAEVITDSNKGWISFAGPGAEQHTGHVLLEDALRQFVAAAR